MTDVDMSERLSPAGRLARTASDRASGIAALAVSSWRLTMADIAINMLLTGLLVVVLLGLMALAVCAELDEEDDE